MEKLIEQIQEYNDLKADVGYKLYNLTKWLLTNSYICIEIDNTIIDLNILDGIGIDDVEVEKYSLCDGTLNIVIWVNYLEESNYLNYPSYIDFKLDNKTYQKYLAHLKLDNINSRLDEISKLKHNWDGYNAEIPSENVLEISKKFLSKLPTKFIDVLDFDDIYPSTHGTIIIEWVTNDRYFVTVEIGEVTSSYFSYLPNNAECCKDKIKNIINHIPDELLKKLNRWYDVYRFIEL